MCAAESKPVSRATQIAVMLLALVLLLILVSPQVVSTIAVAPGLGKILGGVAVPLFLMLVIRLAMQAPQEYAFLVHAPPAALRGAALIDVTCIRRC
jgi:hypothetical protein